MKKEEIERKFDEIVAFSEIERFIDTPVKRYSSGMYMRLAFAIAAHLEPEILIVDEVLAVGDLAFQKKCIGKMDGVAKEGRTVLFVSHGMEAIRKLCARSILLDNGSVVLSGRTEDVITRYVERGSTAQPIYDFAKPPADEDAPGYATRLTIEDQEGNPTTSIPVGKPWQIRISFQIDRPVPHFIIAVGLFANVSTPLRTCWAKPMDLEPGNYEAVFREENLLLAAGRYGIGFGLSSYERSFCYVQDAGVIDIVEVGEGVDVLRTANHGYLLNPFQIEIQRVTP
jgi:lipopolysaccharide transport system ATP-binding protein